MGQAMGSIFNSSKSKAKRTESKEWFERMIRELKELTVEVLVEEMNLDMEDEGEKVKRAIRHGDMEVAARKEQTRVKSEDPEVRISELTEENTTLQQKIMEMSANVWEAKLMEQYELRISELTEENKKQQQKILEISEENQKNQQMLQENFENQKNQQMLQENFARGGDPIMEALASLREKIMRKDC